MDNINTTLEQLFAVPRGTYVVFKAKNECGIRVSITERKGRFILDTDLYNQSSKYDYSENGMKYLQHLAEDSQFSDGVKIESQTKRVFQISFDPDNEANIRNTVGIWLGLLEQTVSNDDYIYDITLER